MTDNRNYPVPGSPYELFTSVTVDLDSREPLTRKEEAYLSTAVERLLCERREISEHIRKINQRIIMSDNREGDRGKK